MVTGPRSVLREVEVDGSIVDVVLAGDVVESVGGSAVGPVDVVIDGEGAALLPGLHDHHVHLLAMATRLGAIDLDGADDSDAADVLLRRAAASGVMRVGGYDDHRHGPLDRDRLDRVGGGGVLRVQHRSGLSWVLSTSALDEVDAAGRGSSASIERDAAGRATGWVHRHDELIADVFGSTAPSLAAVSGELSRLGITGVTDATHALGSRADVLRSAREVGELKQSVVLLGVDGDVGDWAMVGPRKLLADEVRGLDIEGLADEISATHRSGRGVAIHAVTRAECVVAVAALQLAGPMAGDRIEHGSVLPDEFDDFLATSGVIVVVQPSLVRERGDGYSGTVDADDLPFLHRAGSLARAGVAVTVGSDAPVTAIDPWATIATAVDRSTRGGVVLGAAEAVDAATALGWYLADPIDPRRARRVVAGVPADLCLLSVPLIDALARPDAANVRATWVEGSLVTP